MAPNNDLKMAIFKSGKTQWDIAERAGMHETRLSKIVRGRMQPNGDEKKALAKALKKTVHDLFPEEAAVAS